MRTPSSSCVPVTGAYSTCWRAEAEAWLVLGAHPWRTWETRSWFSLQFSGFQSKHWRNSRGTCICCSTLRK